MLRNKRRYFALAGALAVAGGLALAAPAAQATTLTCTNVASATVSPIGCGGIQSATTAHGSLDMAVLGVGGVNGNFFNSPVGVMTDSQSQVREDFTVFAVNGLVTGGPGNLGKYVAMYTQNGRVPSFTVAAGGKNPSNCTGPVLAADQSFSNTVPCADSSFTAGPTTFCLSVVGLNNGPHGALRYNAVLRNCNTNGTFHVGGNTSATTDENSVTSGHANRFQVWAPVTGANGLLFVNQSLSHNFHNGNTQYVLDIKGGGASGSRLLAFPENDGLNQEWSVIGCTKPASALGTGYQFCP